MVFLPAGSSVLFLILGYMTLNFFVPKFFHLSFYEFFINGELMPLSLLNKISPPPQITPPPPPSNVFEVNKPPRGLIEDLQCTVVHW